jgi:protease IV
MNKTSVAIVREIGASGAYWAASGTDKIYASRMSMLGSIGVVASYVEFAGTLERYNATYRSITAGEFKDTGSPFKRLTLREEQMLEMQLNRMHDYFIQSVAENRGLPEAKVREIANGWVYLGEEALELGLIDEIGGEDEVVADLEELIGEPVDAVEYYVPLSFFQEVFGVFKESSFEVGKGIGYAMRQPEVRTIPAVYT